MEKNTVFKCDVCGLMVEVLNPGAHPVCCGQPMTEQNPKTEDEGMEKHVPVIEKTENGYSVKVGDIPHPMEENHFIQWIELITPNKVYRKYLKPGEEPKADFCVSEEAVSAREYCNMHGLWKKSL